MNWHKAEPGQELEDGDELLVTGKFPEYESAGRWYEIAKVSCDEHYFELRDYDDEPCDLQWCDIQYFCHTKDIPPPEEEAGPQILAEPLDTETANWIESMEGTK